jgi:preprotein translocase subunit SecA
VTLTEEGNAQKLSHDKGLAGREPLRPQNLESSTILQQSLRAHTLYQNGKQYIVRDGEVVIVDEFTGPP